MWWFLHDLRNVLLKIFWNRILPNALHIGKIRENVLFIYKQSWSVKLWVYANSEIVGRRSKAPESLEHRGLLPPVAKYCRGSTDAGVILINPTDAGFTGAINLNLHWELCFQAILLNFWPVVIKRMSNHRKYVIFFSVWIYFTHVRTTNRHLFHFESFADTILTRFVIIKCPSSI